MSSLGTSQNFLIYIPWSPVYCSVLALQLCASVRHLHYLDVCLQAWGRLSLQLPLLLLWTLRSPVPDCQWSVHTYTFGYSQNISVRQIQTLPNPKVQLLSILLWAGKQSICLGQLCFFLGLATHQLSSVEAFTVITSNLLSSTSTSFERYLHLFHLR